MLKNVKKRGREMREVFVLLGINIFKILIRTEWGKKGILGQSKAWH